MKIQRLKQINLSAPGDIVSSIIGATAPGSQKLQFPYELPTIKVSIDEETRNALYSTAGILTAGILLGIVLNKKL